MDIYANCPKYFMEENTLHINITRCVSICWHAYEAVITNVGIDKAECISDKVIYDIEQFIFKENIVDENLELLAILNELKSNSYENN